MAHLFDNAHDEPDERQRHAPQRPRWVWAAGVAGLAIVGILSAVLWRAWDDGLPAFPSFASVAAPGAAPTEVADKPVGSKEFRAFQQQIAGSLQSTAQLVAAEHAKIKRLSDQLFAAFRKDRCAAASRRIGTSRRPRPAATGRAKEARSSKQPPGISVGGAPLPPRPAKARQSCGHGDQPQL